MRLIHFFPVCMIQRWLICKTDNIRYVGRGKILATHAFGSFKGGVMQDVCKCGKNNGKDEKQALVFELRRHETVLSCGKFLAAEENLKIEIIGRRSIVHRPDNVKNMFSMMPRRQLSDHIITSSISSEGVIKTKRPIFRFSTP